MKSGHFFGIMRIKAILIIVMGEMEQQPVRESGGWPKHEAEARIKCLTALLLLPGQRLFLTS